MIHELKLMDITFEFEAHCSNHIQFKLNNLNQILCTLNPINTLCTYNQHIGISSDEDEEKNIKQINEDKIIFRKLLGF